MERGKNSSDKVNFSPLSEKKIRTSYFVSYFFSSLILFLILFLKSLTFFHFSHTFCSLNLILFLILFFQSHTFSHTFCTFISYFYFFGSGRSGSRSQTGLVRNKMFRKKLFRIFHHQTKVHIKEST